VAEDRPSGSRCSWRILFGLDGLSSRALQKYYYQRYGTTLRGLMEEHDVGPHDFLDFTHDIDRSSLLPNLALASAIAALPGRKLILTNGSREHALRTADALGLKAMFEDIFDIAAAISCRSPRLRPMNDSLKGTWSIRRRLLCSRTLRESHYSP